MRWKGRHIQICSGVIMCVLRQLEDGEDVGTAPMWKSMCQSYCSAPASTPKFNITLGSATSGRQTSIQLRACHPNPTSTRIPRQLHIWSKNHTLDSPARWHFARSFRDLLFTKYSHPSKVVMVNGTAVTR